MRGWAVGLGVIVALATGCSTNESDPFVDVAAQAGIETVGGGLAGDPVVDGSAVDVATTAAAITETTAAAAPSTPVPSSAPALDAESAYQETVDATVACLAAPASCEPESVVVAEGPAFARFSKLRETLSDAGYLVRHLPDVTRWTIESVVDATADAMSLVVCDVDGDVVYEPATHSGVGQDIVVNDLVVARRVHVDLRRTAAGWRRWSIEPLAEWPMESACAPA